MFNTNKENILLNSKDTIEVVQYNKIIGGMLLYGFLLNILLIFVAREFFMSINPIIFLIGYFVLAIGGSIIVNWSDNPALSFLGYNMICIPIGAVLAICIPSYPTESIVSAVVVTALVTLSMIILSIKFKDFFSKLGTVLIVTLIISFVIELIATLFGYGGNIFNWLFVIIFSLYIGYDWYRAQEQPKTVDNAVDVAVSLYLDIINLFIRLLEILSKKK